MTPQLGLGPALVCVSSPSTGSQPSGQFDVEGLIKKLDRRNFTKVLNQVARNGGISGPNASQYQAALLKKIEGLFNFTSLTDQTEKNINDFLEIMFAFNEIFEGCSKLDEQAINGSQLPLFLRRFGFDDCCLTLERLSKPLKYCPFILKKIEEEVSSKEYLKLLIKFKDSDDDLLYGHNISDLTERFPELIGLVKDKTTIEKGVLLNWAKEYPIYFLASLKKEEIGFFIKHQKDYEILKYIFKKAADDIYSEHEEDQKCKKQLFDKTVKDNIETLYELCPGEIKSNNQKLVEELTDCYLLYYSDEIDKKSEEYFLAAIKGESLASGVFESVYQHAEDSLKSNVRLAFDVISNYPNLMSVLPDELKQDPTFFKRYIKEMGKNHDVNAITAELVKYKQYLEEWIQNYGQTINEYPYFKVHPVVFSDIGGGDADEYMNDIMIRARSSNITFVDKSVLYVDHASSNVIFSATTPTVLFLTLEDINPGLNELLESLIWNGRRLSEHLSIVVVGNAEKITDFSFVSRVVVQCKEYELLAKAKGGATKMTEDLEKSTGLGGVGHDLDPLNKFFEELPIYTSEDLLRTKNKLSIDHVHEKKMVSSGDGVVLVVDNGFELRVAKEFGFTNVFRCISISCPTEDSNDLDGGVPFDIYRSSELFDLDKLRQKILVYKNAAETVVYLPSVPSAKLLCNFYIDENNCSFMFINGEWMQLKAIHFGRSTVTLDVSHEGVNEQNVCGINIEFLREQFFKNPSIEFDTPVARKIVDGIIAMFQNKKPVIIEGSAGSGKDFVIKKFLENMTKVNRDLDYLQITAQQDIPVLQQIQEKLSVRPRAAVILVSEINVLSQEERDDVWHYCQASGLHLIGTQNDGNYGQRFESYETGPWLVIKIPTLANDDLEKVLNKMLKKIDQRLNKEKVLSILLNFTPSDHPGVRQSELFINAVVKFMRKNERASNDDLNVFLNQLFYSFFRLNILMVEKDISKDGEMLDTEIKDYAGILYNGLTPLATRMTELGELGSIDVLDEGSNKGSLSLFSSSKEIDDGGLDPLAQIEPRNISGEFASFLTEERIENALVKSKAIGALTPIFHGEFKLVNIQPGETLGPFEEMPYLFFHPGDSFQVLEDNTVKNTSDKPITLYVSNDPKFILKSGDNPKLPTTYVKVSLESDINIRFPWMIGQSQPIFCLTNVSQLNVKPDEITSSKDMIVYLFYTTDWHLLEYYTWFRNVSFCEPIKADQGVSFVSPATPPLSLTQDASGLERYFENELVRCFIMYRLGRQTTLDEAPSALLKALGAPDDVTDASIVFYFIKFFNQFRKGANTHTPHMTSLIIPDGSDLLKKVGKNYYLEMFWHMINQTGVCRHQVALFNILAKVALPNSSEYFTQSNGIHTFITHFKDGRLRLVDLNYFRGDDCKRQQDLYKLLCGWFFGQKQVVPFENKEFIKYLLFPHGYSVELVMAFPEYKEMIAANEFADSILNSSGVGVDGGSKPTELKPPDSSSRHRLEPPKLYLGEGPSNGGSSMLRKDSEQDDKSVDYPKKRLITSDGFLSEIYDFQYTTSDMCNAIISEGLPSWLLMLSQVPHELMIGLDPIKAPGPLKRKYKGDPYENIDNLFNSLAFCIKNNLPKTLVSESFIIGSAQYQMIIKSPAHPQYETLRSHRAHKRPDGSFIVSFTKPGLASVKDIYIPPACKKDDYILTGKGVCKNDGSTHIGIDFTTDHLLQLARHLKQLGITLHLNNGSASISQGQSAGASGVGGPVPMPVNLHNALCGAHGPLG